MYKVFISEKEVSFLSDQHFKQIDSNVFFANKIIGDKHDFLLNKLSSFKSVKILCENPYLEMMTFFTGYKIINAGGGLVVNNNNFLWIFRNNMWDLPKGKKEKNEDISSTAIREVQEECGIGLDLKISRFLVTTFHTYFIQNVSVLKRTDWYLMQYNGQDLNLTPQLEEGITNVKWLSKSESKIKAKNTFKSIGQVWSAYNDCF